MIILKLPSTFVINWIAFVQNFDWGRRWEKKGSLEEMDDLFKPKLMYRDYIAR